MTEPASPVVDLAALYRARFSPDELARRRELWRVLCRHFFQRYVDPSATVLDLACGFGEFLNAIRAGRKLGVDLNPDVAAHLDPAVELHLGSCEDLSFLDDGAVDVVFESNCLEHLPDKHALSRLAREVYRVLRPGGRFVALQPNIRYVGGAYWDFYDHHIPLTHVSCRELLVASGFTIERLVPRFLPYTTKSRLPQAPWAVRAYLACPPLWRVLGKQFLVVAVRPEVRT